MRFLREHGMPVPTELLDTSRVLIIDRDPAFLRGVKRLLRRAAPELAPLRLADHFIGHPVAWQALEYATAG